MALGTRVEHGLEVGEMYFVVYLSKKKRREMYFVGSFRE